MEAEPQYLFRKDRDKERYSFRSLCEAGRALGRGDMAGDSPRPASETLRAEPVQVCGDGDARQRPYLPSAPPKSLCCLFGLAVFRMIAYAACLEGSDPVRLFDKRVNAKREPGYVFDKVILLQYNHMSFGGAPVEVETEEEAEELMLQNDKDSANALHLTSFDEVKAVIIGQVDSLT
ncbi:uncharacterized protein LOC122020075 isoform X1 [Zingiber officinale]|uniref:uncharacterized protein LOC122020075 isoform X1 n=1 Tax=Zingiber officinale TaxID=94328 RepID=UPI001C4AC858|nr:uncharacterized protein LOC122020075 isoform X1 [Zingiber officinale]XP_042433744.1 uncharacterized protein LOC122020075 isoform X1 [Zingiber officinale]